MDKACLGFLEASELATFAEKSKDRHGFSNTFSAMLFDTLSPFSPKFLKKSLNPLTFLVLPLTVVHFFLLQSEQKPINTLLLSEVNSP